MSDDQQESPLAGRSAEDGAGTSNSAHEGELVDVADPEDAPDWLAFAAFAKSTNAASSKNLRHAGNGTLADAPLIPKRGEKDFEPASEDRYINLQTSLLSASRDALYTAIGSGIRSHPSKAHNRAVWDEHVNRAYLVHAPRPDLPPQATENHSANFDAEGNRLPQPNTAHGVHFLTMGIYDQQRKRLELLPEELLYLMERGTVECWASQDDNSVPFSFQQTWAKIMATPRMFAERYQVYAYLRRLGYTVTRADELILPANSMWLHRHELLSTRLHRSLLQPLAFVARYFVHFLQVLNGWIFNPGVSPAMYRLEFVRQGKARSLVGSHRWYSYDQVFTVLQVVRCGWAGNGTPQDKRKSNPYKVLWNVYKPITKFKKSNPPEPDFRVAVINANETPIPDLYDFCNIFTKLPYDGVPYLGLPRPYGPKQHEMRIPINHVLGVWSRFWQYVRIGMPAVPGHPLKANPRSLSRPFPYTRLKAGRKSAIIAVLDNGTISFQRFGQTNFAEFPWVGDGPVEDYPLS